MLGLACLLALHSEAGSSFKPKPAPEFPTRDARRWVGPPQRLADLRGQVVLLDVWTFG